MGVLGDEQEADMENETEAVTQAFAALSLGDGTASPHPDHLVKIAVQLAQELLKVDSNAKGGSAAWRTLRDQLHAAVESLPEQPARAKALDRLSEMARSFVAKTKASWRP